ncbi:MAG: ribonuclease D [Alphaproteobacteria bacterium]|nr:ribonuclease D [Alphaproteobacteria bacterium]
MNFIQTSSELADLCEKLAQEPYVAVDTEFIREKTYWPRLCLIQIASDNDEACIDPLAMDLDMAPLFALMANPNVVKVFHSARQDLEIFYNLTGKVPAPLFDTQIAAMVCGFGESVSYQNICASLLKVNLDKSQRFTDWSHRPLAPRQIEYALCDVTYLRDVYKKLKEKLESEGRVHWVDEEMALISSPETYKINPDECWKKIKSNSKDRRFLAVLKELAKWRELEAQRINRPRKRILFDENLVELALCQPRDRYEISNMRGFPKGIADSRYAGAILEAIEIGKATLPEKCPEVKPRPEAPKGKKALVELLHLLLEIKSEEYDVAPKLIATSDDIVHIAIDGKPNVPAMSGWRKDVFGDDALALKNGELFISYHPNKRRINLTRKETKTQ